MRILRKTYFNITRQAQYIAFFLTLSLFSILIMYPAQADCLIYPFHKSQPKVERFIMQPVSLRRDFPQGGDDMVYHVQVIASSSRASIKPLIDSVKLSNEQQKRAIATGLAKAAWLCELKSTAQTRRIEMAVKGFANSEFTRNFNQNYHAADYAKTGLPHSLSSQSTVAPHTEGRRLERDLGNPLAPIPAISSVPSVQNIPVTR